MNENVNRMTIEKAAEYNEILSGKRLVINPSEWKPIPISATFPVENITLDGGIFKKLFEENISYIKKWRIVK